MSAKVPKALVTWLWCVTQARCTSQEAEPHSCGVGW